MQTYYVAFQKSNFRRPWHLFTWNKYEHCWVFYQDPQGTSIKVEAILSRLSVESSDYSLEALAKIHLKHEDIIDIVKISLPVPPYLSYTIHGFINCVTIVKFAIGLSDWLIFTPEQLRRRLLRLGGRSLKNE